MPLLTVVAQVPDHDTREARASLYGAERRLRGPPTPETLAAVENRLGLGKIHADAALATASALVLATDESASEDTLLAAHGLYGSRGRPRSG